MAAHKFGHDLFSLQNRKIFWIFTLWTKTRGSKIFSDSAKSWIVSLLLQNNLKWICSPTPCDFSRLFFGQPANHIANILSFIMCLCLCVYSTNHIYNKWHNICYTFKPHTGNWVGNCGRPTNHPHSRSHIITNSKKLWAPKLSLSSSI